MVGVPGSTSRNERLGGCWGGHYLGNGHKNKQNEHMVCDHEAFLLVFQNGEGMSAALVPGSIPLTEVHGVGVIDHVGNQKPDILSGQASA